MPSDPFFQGEPPGLVAAMASAIGGLVIGIVTLWRRLGAKDQVIEEKDRVIHAIQEARVQEHKESARELTTARRILDRAIDTVSSVRTNGGNKP